MLRAYDRPGGIGIYARNIVRSLLSIDDKNEYLLLHTNPEHIGKYADHENVDEVFLPSRHPVFWDQYQVPRYLADKKIDLLLNTKFSVPFAGKYKKLMVLHGASWYRHPELYGRFDVFYTRLMLPVYCRKSDFLISNSDLTTKDYRSIFSIPENKIRTVNLAAGSEFQPVTDQERLDQVRRRYRLPEEFLLTVTSYDPRKNFGTLVTALEECRKVKDLSLVVVGKDCDKYNADFDVEARGLGNNIHYPGWIEQGDLPAIYSLASAFVFPSVYEEFGIPVVEAISTGCPVISSSTGAIPDLLGDAALLCDPFDTEQLTKNILSVTQDDQVREALIRKGFDRSQQFSWNLAASATLAIFDEVCHA